MTTDDTVFEKIEFLELMVYWGNGFGYVLDSDALLIRAPTWTWVRTYRQRKSLHVSELRLRGVWYFVTGDEN